MRPSRSSRARSQATMTGGAQSKRPIRMTMEREPRRMMHAVGYPWEHAVHVVLPASYRRKDVSYPVLWVTDLQLNLDLSVAILSLLPTMGEAPEMIIVGVGTPLELGAREFYRR